MRFNCCLEHSLSIQSDHERRYGGEKESGRGEGREGKQNKPSDDKRP